MILSPRHHRLCHNIMKNNIKTLKDLAEFINQNKYWVWNIENIIQRNGWISDCGEAFGICHDSNGNRVVINEIGEAVVI